MNQTSSLISSSKRHRNSGFSLIEILIVIGLIAMLATLVIVNVGDTFSRQGDKVATMFAKTTVKIPLTEYRLDIGNFPSTEEGLAALMKAPSSKQSRWKGPYAEQIPLDPWNNPYQYRYPGSKNVSGARGYDVWSWGPDGTESADDIGNW